MKHGQLLLIGIAILGLVALCGSVVHRFVKSELGPSKFDVDVAIADEDLQVGTAIKDSDVKIEKRPPDSLPAGVFRTKEILIGRGVILPIAKGEFILPSHLAEYSRIDRPTVPEMRALSVQVKNTVPANAFVRPNARVDVLFTIGHPGSSQAQSRILVNNAAVLASEQYFEATAAGGPPESINVTLLVSYNDARKLILARKDNLILVVRESLPGMQMKP